MMFCKKCQILFINTFLSGGAAKGAQFLFKSIAEKCSVSTFLFHVGEIEDKKYFIRYADIRWFDFFKSKKISRILRKFGVSNLIDTFEKKYLHDARYSLFSLPVTRYKISNIGQAHIIHLNWIVRFVNYPSFFKSIKKHQKIIWTLRDMNPMTGGCHHADDCVQFYEKCHSCPQLEKSSLDTSIADVFSIKYRALQNISDDQMVIVCPSKWVLHESKKSTLQGRFKHVHISHGVDINAFSPRDKIECRQKYNITQEKKVILFVSDSLQNERKGLKLLFEAVRLLKLDDVLLLSMGKNTGEILSFQNGVEYISMGFVDSNDKMAEIYSLADVFITPSYAESFGFTIAEALCCGTPVIGFETTAITEKIIPGINGYLVHLQDVEDLHDKIELFFKNGVNQTNEEISMHARELYSHITMRDKYLALYKSICVAGE